MIFTEHYSRLQFEIGSTTFSIFYMHATGYALAHNRIPVVPLITIENNKESENSKTLPAGELSIRGTAGSDELFNTGPIKFDELSPGQFTYIKPFDKTRVSISKTLQSSESLPGEIEVRIHAGEDLLVNRADLLVLAPNEWFNAPAFFESLAAFSQPNGSEITPLLDATANILEARTGSSSIEGYQNGTERAIAIAAAIYEALQQYNIRYINPPASFEETGQRVRSSSEVLQSRLGTRVDLSLTFSAVAEQCGLRPVILMVPGHALTGIITTNDPLGSPVEFDPAVINNYLRSGRIMPIEAFFYHKTGFTEVVEETRDRYIDTAIYGVIDILESHRDGIHPLPSMQTQTPDNTSLDVSTASLSTSLSAIDIPPTSASADTLTDSAKKTLPTGTSSKPWILPSSGRVDEDSIDAVNAVKLEAADDSPARIQNWKRELLDLSLRNRLLNMRNSKEVLEFRLPEGTLADLDDKIHAGEKISIHPKDEVSENRKLQGIQTVDQLPVEQVIDSLVNHNRLYADVTETRYKRFFQGLTRQVRTYLEETGSANLYLTLGSLAHTSPSGATVQAPLFLIPVKIIGGRGKARFQIQVDTTQEASPNYCLVEWFKQRHGIVIDALSNPRLDASGLDIAYALTAISDALVDAKLPFTVIENSRLIIARFSTYGMWKDLRDSWQTFMKAPVFNHLVKHAGEVFNDPAGELPIRDIVVDEKELALPIPADGAQLKAISAAAAGRSFVLEGPPGTGKSQTITNLIAHALDTGKSILFVAEKQAALEVVQSRLAKIGLDPFSLNLHSGEQSPQAIKRQLKDSIDAEVFYDSMSWDNAVSNLRSRLTPLLEYPERIHAKNGAGYSLWSAESSLTSMGKGVAAQLSESFVAHPPTDLTELKSHLEEISVRAGFTDFSAIARWRLVGPNITPRNAKFENAWKQLESARDLVASSSAVKEVLQAEDIDAVIATLREVEGLSANQRLSATQRQSYAVSESRLTAFANDVSRFHQEVGPVSQLFSLSFIQSGDPAPLLSAIAETRGGFFGKKKRLAAYQQLLRSAVAPGTEQIDINGQHNPANIEMVLHKLPQLRAVAERLSSTLREIPGAEALYGRSVFDFSLPHDAWEQGQNLREAIDTSERLSGPLELFDRLIKDLSSFRSPTSDVNVISTLSTVASAWRSWLEVLDSNDAALTAWCGKASWVTAWLNYADEWARDISSHGSEDARRVSKWISVSQPLRAAGLDDFIGQIESGVINKNEVKAAFERGLAEASIAERSSHFLLSDFHPALKEEELNQLHEALRRVRDESQRAIPARLLRKRPYQPGKLTGRAAELRRQLDVKRNAMSFRKLLQEYGDEILTIAPCFFVSPASLATFVAPGAVTFDIVVFDEASQVTVDQAVGALGRARSAVIVGDSRQMPPTRVGKATSSNDGDYDDSPDEDVNPHENIDDLESILSEAVESGLPQMWLSWHYRSKDESLIAFSNHNYYNGNLSSLPSPGSIPGAGVHVRRVQGQFIRDKKNKGLLRTNPVEAEAIVDSIVRRVNSPLTKDESIGVVTFNIQQRELIMNLLEDCGDALVLNRLAPGPDNIFVKNLENVQGDERDVILFSTAFSKHEDGRPMPMNFGPLTRFGGERRLNVAITRARKEVEVFCSFDPSEIELSRTNSVGLRHLRGYLEAGLENDARDTSGIHSQHRAKERFSVNDNRLRDAIAERLRQRGWIVETDYGQSSYTLDLVVRPKDDNRWHAAILTDSEKWANLETVADRDLTPSLLEIIMQWGAAIRVWLPEWLSNPDATIDRIERELRVAGQRIRKQDEERRRAQVEAERFLAAERERLAAAQAAEEEARKQAVSELTQSEKATDDTAVQQRADEILGKEDEAETEEAGVQWSAETADCSDEKTVITTKDSPQVEILTNEAPQVEVPSLSSSLTTEQQQESMTSSELPTEIPVGELPTSSLGEREELENGFSSTRIRELEEEMQRVIKDCAPLPLRTLRTNFVQRFGRQKTSKMLNSNRIDPLIPQALLREDCESGELFVWPTDQGPDGWRHFRRTEARGIKDIPIEEIRNVAQVLIAEDSSLKIPAPELREKFARSILSVFGLSRYTKAAQIRINTAIEGLD